MAVNQQPAETGISWAKFTAEILPDPTYNKMFSKHDFVEDSFAVDFFVDRHKDQPLEELRELLSSFLKKLRVACLDLMNEDYANFVHLSTTLFDLSKSVEVVYNPLIKAREDIRNVRSRIEASSNTLHEKIEHFKEIRRKISVIDCLVDVSNDVSDVESSLKNFDSLDRLQKRLVSEKSLDLLTSAERFMRKNTIESDSTRKLVCKITHLLQFVKSYKTSNEYLTCPFEFLLQKKYE